MYLKGRYTNKYFICFTDEEVIYKLESYQQKQKESVYYLDYF